MKTPALILCSAILITASGCASKPANQKTQMVRDALAKETVTKNYRTTERPRPGIKNLNGFKALRMSGSGQFTPLGLKAILSKSAGPVTVFDLRQESHGFVDDNPVTWYAEHDWANKGKTHDEVIAKEKRKLGKLTKEKQVPVDENESVDLGSFKTATEEEVVRGAGANYVRLTVTDHLKPEDSEVERFIEAVRALPEKGSVHFHCRAGQGRTTTFMVLYDMLKNAKTISMKDIVDRQAQLGRDYDVLNSGPTTGWKHQYQVERAAFVEAFYQYAKQNPNGFPKSWLEWTSTH